MTRATAGACYLAPKSGTAMPWTLEGRPRSWRDLGIEVPSVPIKDDLSNLDVVSDAILKWWNA